MIDPKDLANIMMATAAFTLMSFGLISLYIDRTMDRWSSHFFGTMFLLLLLVNFLDLFSEPLIVPLFAISPKWPLYGQSLLSGMLIPLLTFYLLHCTGQDFRRASVFWIVFSVFVFYAVLLTVTQFTTFIYYYTPDIEYHRGPWYPLLLIPPILSMLLLLIAVLRRRRKLSRRQFLGFLLYTLLPAFGMLIQMFFYGIYAVGFGTTLAVMSMYLFIMIDRAEKQTRRQEEILRQRSSITMLQMRPHFIYNTLLSIYYLCEQDVKKAQQVILDFSSYLRQNFTAISKADMISISEELEHTRAYLSVEQVRFSDMLFVEFDTPFTRFRVPPLTLQPIVENAVKHGVDPELGPLTITVRTRKTRKGSEIVVTDNGPGYSPADDDEPHIALGNIRERLRLMCGGTLDIRSRPDGGTVVTIMIPDKSRNKSQEPGTAQ